MPLVEKTIKMHEKEIPYPNAGMRFAEIEAKAFLIQKLSRKIVGSMLFHCR